MTVIHRRGCPTCIPSDDGGLPARRVPSRHATGTRTELKHFAAFTVAEARQRHQPALPWTIGAKRLQRNGDTIQANGVFINIAATCDAFAGSAVLSADDVRIKPGSN